MPVENLLQKYNEYFFGQVIRLMKPRNFALILCFFMLIGSKTLPEISDKNIPSKFREEYNNYMTLYYNEDCSYPNGFSDWPHYRSGVSFIINKENGKEYKE